MSVGTRRGALASTIRRNVFMDSKNVFSDPPHGLQSDAWRHTAVLALRGAGQQRSDPSSQLAPQPAGILPPEERAGETSQGGDIALPTPNPQTPQGAFPYASNASRGALCASVSCVLPGSVSSARNASYSSAGMPLRPGLVVFLMQTWLKFDRPRGVLECPGVPGQASTPPGGGGQCLPDHGPYGQENGHFQSLQPLPPPGKHTHPGVNFETQHDTDCWYRDKGFTFNLMARSAKTCSPNYPPPKVVPLSPLSMDPGWSEWDLWVLLTENTR